ncbi:nucleotide exchange factor SIL1 [Rhinophrynus dorsalis]
MDLHLLFRYIVLRVKLAVLLSSLCFYVCLSHQSPGYALTVVEDAEDDGDLESVVQIEDEYDPEDHEVFHPTREWQVVKPGQAVPAGLHMRLNLQTGMNEAKLLDENNDDKQERTHKSPFVSETYTGKELKEALAKFKEGVKMQNSQEEEVYVKDIKQRFKQIEDLKKEFNDLHINIETDFEIMTKIINRFNNSLSTTAEKINALNDLEYYVHQVDNAQNLFKLGALQLLISCLNSTDPLLIEHSAFVIGSALASNPKVQIEAFEGGALQKLLVVLAAEHTVSVKKKALYALSSMLRQFPYAQQQFLKLGGLQILKNVFREKKSELLYVRVITLLYDMIVEKLLLHKENNTGQKEEQNQQYNKVHLLESITEQGWCTIISNLLRLPENDAREKVLKTVSVLIPSCREEFKKDQNLYIVLHSLKKEYEDLVRDEQSTGENDGYFSELLNLTNSVLGKLK